MEQESIIASKSTKVISYATAAVEPIGGGVANAAAASNSAAANANSRRPMNAFLLFCKRHRGNNKAQQFRLSSKASQQ